MRHATQRGWGLLRELFQKTRSKEELEDRKDVERQRASVGCLAELARVLMRLRMNTHEFIWRLEETAGART